MLDEKKDKVELKKEEPKVVKPLREIIIQTDGDSINLFKADVSGRIELVGILATLLDFLNKQNGSETTK